MGETELINRAFDAGAAIVSVVCLTLVVGWHIKLTGNHLKHWTEEMAKTREVYERLTDTLADLKSWCARRHGGD